MKLPAGFLFLTAVLAAQTTEVTLVAPNVNATVSGNATAPLPTTAVSLEFQELIGGGQLPASPVQIVGMSYRAAPGTGPISGSIGNISVYLSTSPNYPNTVGGGKTLMSTTFANNAGPDKTLVYSASNVTFGDPGCPAPGPCPFDLNIQFTTPFYFNAGGPILVDILESNLVAKSGAEDAVSSSAPGGSVAEVVGTLGSPTGTFQYQGNVIQLTYLGAAAAGSPAFTGVVNPASNVPPGFPHSGIAQGSIFVAYGTNLGPGNLAQAASLPLSTNLAGTSLSVAVNGTTVACPIVYTYAGQVAAVLPSNTPVGNGTLTLTYSGKSGTTPITVVQSNFGISTVNESGGGAAVVTFGNYSVVSTTNSAKPGDGLTLWGTGLGALPAGQSDAGAAAGGNLPAAITVFVGGVQASIAYQGRTPSAVGLDQINFTVPPNAPLGCNVPIIVQTTAPNPTVSNTATIALAATDGATCSDPVQIVPTSYLGKNSLKVVYTGVTLNSSVNGGGSAGTTITGKAAAGFLQFTQSQIGPAAVLLNTEPTLGSCITGVVAGGGPSTMPAASYLNGGASVTLTPPSGSPIVLPAQSQGGLTLYQNKNVTAAPSGIWNFSNPGGPDVGPSNFSFTMPAKVTWTNQNNLSGNPIDRTQPLTITWSGGDSNGYVDIVGTGQTGPAGAPAFTSYFQCAAPTAGGSFTIPAAVLQGLPAGPGAYSSLQVSTNTMVLTLPAITGFDAGVNNSQFQTNVPVIFK
jgi:uncharacterized protein (TIGR03437 family)